MGSQFCVLVCVCVSMVRLSVVACSSSLRSSCLFLFTGFSFHLSFFLYYFLSLLLAFPVRMYVFYTSAWAFDYVFVACSCSVLLFVSLYWFLLFSSMLSILSLIVLVCMFLGRLTLHLDFTRLPANNDP
ncbi:hypothetical protein BDV30DRAFT_143537 [Aspergillus minisclerotigenes]|uniref:Uncharacterized protein n=1 Tax=Aspergillus minisclerotigenes TaxID=656917 RepID=A0A5N6IZD9_9EURO|nr:hypothetical protein BDV30DRAFT_143537 [Aspergillus minisclerotigenes]